MGFLNKLGIGIGTQTAREGARSIAGERNSHSGNGSVMAVGTNRPPEPQETSRGSNGLKEFLWNLDGLGRGTLLDLGPAWQTTLTFFIERGFRVTSDDILRDWSQFLAEEDAKAKASGEATPESYAERPPRPLEGTAPVAVLADRGHDRLEASVGRRGGGEQLGRPVRECDERGLVLRIDAALDEERSSRVAVSDLGCALESSERLVRRA